MPAGHSFSPARCARVPAEQRQHDAAISPRIRYASPTCEPSKRFGRTTLRITTAATTPTSTSTRTGRRGMRTSPGARATGALVPVDRGDHRHHDRREEDEEAPEDERVHQPGYEPLQELALAEDDLGLVLTRRGTSLCGRPACRADEPRRGRARGARRAPPHDEREQRASADGAYGPRTFLSSRRSRARSRAGRRSRRSRRWRRSAPPGRR